MKVQMIAALLATTALVGGAYLQPAYAAAASVSIDADDIGGRVTGANGKPEAGVWVIAQTHDLSTRHIKIVVTDDDGRYVLPDLTKAKYDVWVRGYGLIDSKPVVSEPGKIVDLKATAAPSAKEAAQYYPANYWYSLIGAPAASEFPGTGPKGNGIAPTMASQQHWLSSMKGCMACHQWGGPVMRTMPESGNSAEAWYDRIAKFREMNDPTYNNHSQALAAGMINGVSSFGRDRVLQLFADWTDRIRNGALPAETPPRPTGTERNVVVSIWDWGQTQFAHDIISTDRRNPQLNAGGSIYGVDLWNSIVLTLDPKSAKTGAVTIPQSYKRSTNTSWGPGGPMPHNPMMDHKGRIWMTDLQPVLADTTFCTDPKNKFAKLFPTSSDHNVHMYDPAANKVVGIPTCFGSHHLAFSFDKENVLYFSGDSNVMGWINANVYDDTKDISKAIGWCPIVLDTNGDGKITQDRTAWNAPSGGRSARPEGELDGLFAAKTAGPAIDPKKDTRIAGFLYGVNVSPKDGSVWFAKTSPALPGGIVRLMPGANPPETCQVEYYEPPKGKDGTYEVFGTRGLDIDNNGIVWTSHGSGNISKFDRSKCKTLNGPTATGQQCAEGWTSYSVPGPKIQGTNVNTDFNYLAWVDLYNSSGMGKDTVIVPGSNSDALIALDPNTGKTTLLRVPYPMGFFARGLDGRIDDPNTGWKGRSLWSNFGTVPVDHQEDGTGDTSKVVQFQVRPDPLAH